MNENLNEKSISKDSGFLNLKSYMKVSDFISCVSVKLSKLYQLFTCFDLKEIIQAQLFGFFFLSCHTFITRYVFNIVCWLFWYVALVVESLREFWKKICLQMGTSKGKLDISCMWMVTNCQKLGLFIVVIFSLLEKLWLLNFRHLKDKLITWDLIHRLLS